MENKDRTELIELCKQQIEANKKHQTMIAWHDAETPKRFLAALSAEQPEPVGEVGTMPGTAGFTMACFKAEDVPVGTKLYTGPIAAPASQPSGLHPPQHVLDGCGLTYEQCAEIAKGFPVAPHEVDLIVKAAIRITGHSSRQPDAGVIRRKALEEITAKVKSHFDGWYNLRVDMVFAYLDYLAQAPQEQQEQAVCGACHGSGWVVRDFDTGTDQECFACDGTGRDLDAAPVAQQAGQPSPKQSGALCASCYSPNECKENGECNHHGYALNSEAGQPAPALPEAEVIINAAYEVDATRAHELHGKTMTIFADDDSLFAFVRKLFNAAPAQEGEKK